jgi:hypothetical protein
MEQLEQDIEKEHTADWTERPRVESLGTKTAAGNTEVYEQQILRTENKPLLAFKKPTNSSAKGK